MNEGAVALALAAAALFGIALVITQRGLAHLDAGRGAVVAIPTACALFWLATPVQLDAGAWNAEAALIFAAVGVVFPATVTLLTFEANRRMGPAVAGAVGNLAPVVAVAFAAAFLGETPTAGQLSAIGVVVAGITVMSLARGAGANWPLSALLLPLGAASLRGGIQPAVKLGLVLWSSPFAAALIGYTISSAVVILAAALRGQLARERFPGRGCLWFAAVGVCNGLAVLTMYAALARGPVALVSPLVATYPLFTVALGAAMFRGSLNGGIVLGVGLTVAGIAGLLIAASRS